MKLCPMNKYIDNLSIQPSFYCNFNCPYCYLGKLRKDESLLPLNKLEMRLKEISEKYYVRNITLYGGEISLLDKGYLQSLSNLCESICSKITVVSNLSNLWLVDFCDSKNYTLSISLNEERPNYIKTLNKIESLERKDNKNLSIVVLPSILNKSPESLLNFYNNIGIDIFFIQYHPSIYSETSYNISIDEYSNFLKGIIEQYFIGNYSIKIINEDILRNKEYNPNLDGFLFINPQGNYSTVIYKDNIEEYLEFDNLRKWEECCKKEYIRYFNQCQFCEYFNHCKAEHLEVINKKECSGLYKLQKWYEKVKNGTYYKTNC